MQHLIKFTNIGIQIQHYTKRYLKSDSIWFIMKVWIKSDSILLKVLAVLATVTEVIKENDGKESETEYFAALVIIL